LICEGNIIEHAFSGIDWRPKVDNDSSAIIRNNTITNLRDDGIGINIRSTLDPKRNGRVSITGNYASGTERGSRGLLVQYSDQYRFSDVAVESNIFHGDYADAEILYDGTEAPIKFENNYLMSGKFKRSNMATWHK
jgi:hypothetical protein